MSSTIPRSSTTRNSSTGIVQLDGNKPSNLNHSEASEEFRKSGDDPLPEKVPPRLSLVPQHPDESVSGNSSNPINTASSVSNTEPSSMISDRTEADLTEHNNKGTRGGTDDGPNGDSDDGDGGADGAKYTEGLPDDIIGALGSPSIEDNTPAAEALRATSRVHVRRVDKLARRVHVQSLRKFVKRATLRGNKRGKPPRIPPPGKSGSGGIYVVEEEDGDEDGDNGNDESYDGDDQDDDGEYEKDDENDGIGMKKDRRDTYLDDEADDSDGEDDVPGRDDGPVVSKASSRPSKSNPEVIPQPSAEKDMAVPIPYIDDDGDEVPNEVLTGTLETGKKREFHVCFLDRLVWPIPFQFLLFFVVVGVVAVELAH